MSLFQCENCGCVENTACSFQGIKPMADEFDFSGMEERKDMLLCSACAPSRFIDDDIENGMGVWHGEFDRIFLPKGMFKTNSAGNLEHTETGEENYSKYIIKVME